MHEKLKILMLNFVLLFSVAQVAGQQLFAVQVTVDQVAISPAVMQASDQTIDLGLLVSTESILLMKSKVQIAQNILYVGLFRKLQSVSVCSSEDEGQLNFNLKLFTNIQRMKNIVAMSILFLCSSGDLLIGAQQADEPTASEVYLECIPRHIHGLPMTFATNLAGNGTANAIALLSPDPVTAGAAAGCLGCVGGVLESYSADTTYFSQNCIDIHRNFKTGFVADQVCVPVSGCYSSLIQNVAAGASVSGYAAGLCVGYAVQKCRRQGYCDLNNYNQLGVELAPISSMVMDR